MGEGSTPQQAFLASSFKLCSRKGNHHSARKLKDGQKPRASGYENFVEIELSSPLGRHIVTSSKLGLDAQTQDSSGFKSAEEYVKEVEKCCPATSKALKTCDNVKKGWMNAFKGSKKKWVHFYCFTPAEREKRAKELRFGLPAEVMRLLRKSKKRKAEVNGVFQQSGGEEVQGGIEVDGVNPEDVAVLDEQSRVNNNDGIFEEEEVMTAAGISLVINPPSNSMQIV